MRETSNQISGGTSAPINTAGDALEALRRFARPRPNVERCELCGAAIPSNHPHLLDRRSRQVACSCDACSILFADQQSARFLRVPRRTLKLTEFRFSDAEWDAMTLPIGLAFFLRDATGRATALYPSPAGVMESLIELPAWPELTRNHPTLAALEPEVEALLVHRIGEQQGYFVAPIDTTYRLVGLIRTKWRGLSGGTAVWQAIAEFFGELDCRATHVGEVTHA
ncbi:MAG TPA: DUF5947 family protein [Terracidiphilus sp.]|jgi:hypothetical protein